MLGQSWECHLLRDTKMADGCNCTRLDNKPEKDLPADWRVVYYRYVTMPPKEPITNPFWWGACLQKEYDGWKGRITSTIYNLTIGTYYNALH